jgi:hypothetical protein
MLNGIHSDTEHSVKFFKGDNIRTAIVVCNYKTELHPGELKQFKRAFSFLFCK